MELIDYSSSIYSVIPAFLAIVLAIATRRVLVSLSAGIIVGTLMLVDFHPLDALIYLKDNVVALVYSDENADEFKYEYRVFPRFTWRIDRTFNGIR